MPQSFQIGIKGIIRQDDTVLLLKFRRYDGTLTWDLPGGRIDNQETIEEAFIREMHEELPGFANPKLEKLLHAERASENFNDGQGFMWLFYAASATIKHFDDLTEHEGYVWASKEDIVVLESNQDIIFLPAFARAARMGLE